MSELKINNYSLKPNNDLRQRSLDFSINIIKLTSHFPNRRVFLIISDQLLRSATSVGANITEAKAASSKRDFIKYYEIALKSANETQYWLDLLINSKLLKKTVVQKHHKEVKEICNMLGASLLTLKGKRKLNSY